MPGPYTDFIVPTAYFPYGPITDGSPASVTALEVMMITGFFHNPTAAAITLTITDAAGQPIVTAREIVAGGDWTMPTNLSRFIGLKMSCSALGAYGELMGYPIV